MLRKTPMTPNNIIKNAFTNNINNDSQYIRIPRPVGVTTFNNLSLKKIINVYQPTYKNGVAQGLGDYIRGCFCLYQIAEKLHLSFDMDLSNHPMFKYLHHGHSNTTSIDYTNISKYMDPNYIPVNSLQFTQDPAFYPKFLRHLNKLEEDSDTYCLFSNSFPISNVITSISRSFIRSKISPNEMMRNCIDDTLQSLKLTKHKFSVIHIRCGDKYLLKNDMLPYALLQKIIKIVKPLKKDRKYLILSDNNQVKYYLKHNPHFVIQFNKIAHLGEQKNLSNLDEAIKNTLLDFYLMSYSTNIIAISPYTWGSGFSEWCGVLHNIPYQKINIS